MKRSDFLKSTTAVSGGMVTGIHQSAAADAVPAGKLWRIARTGRAAALGVLLLGLLLPGCTPAAQDQSTGSATSTPAASPGQVKVLLRIVEFAHAPAVGADVQVSVHGRQLVDAKAATNQYGVFVAPVRRAWLPDESLLRISISGGTIDDQPFPAHLSADVRITDVASQILVVNPVTTLVSRLLDEQPGLDLNQAQARVRSFLTLPANYPLGQALRQGPHYTCRFFSPAAFVAEAEAAGGLDAFEHLLLQELASGLTHSFRPAPVLGSTTGDALVSTSTATSLVQTGMEAAVLDYAGANNAANLTGWAMSLSGLSSGGSSDIDALEEELQEIVSLIENLAYEVAQLTNLVQSTATQTQYVVITTTASQYATQIQGHESDLETYSNWCPPLPAGSPPNPPDSTCTTLFNNLMTELQTENVGKYYEEVQGYVQDNGTLGTSGMLHLYSLWLSETRSFFRAADSTKMQNLYDYWDSILTSAANLRMEYYHFQGLQNGPAGQATLIGFMGDPTKNPPTSGTFQANESANVKLILWPVPEGTVVSTVDHTMWALLPWQSNPAVKIGGLMYPAAGCQAYDNPGGLGGNSTYDAIYAGFTQGNGWYDSPTKDQWQAAVKNAPPGTDWMQWLIDQTKTTGDETPASDGFFNFVKCPHAAWTSTYDSSEYWAIFPNGQSTFIQAHQGDLNMMLPTRIPGNPNNSAVNPNEQYFWYK